EVLAHSVLGGPKRAPRLARDRVLVPLATTLGVTPAELVLAYLLHVHPAIVPLVGARRPESVVSAVRAADLSPAEPMLLSSHARRPQRGGARGPPTRRPRSLHLPRDAGARGADQRRAAHARAPRRAARPRAHGGARQERSRTGAPHRALPHAARARAPVARRR